jgi:sulfur carrier protein
VTVLLNGEPVAVDEGSTVATLLDTVGIERDARGIAVAVDGEVVPRATWAERELGPDACVEVLTAIQGG